MAAPIPKRISRKRQHRIQEALKLRELGLTYPQISERLNISLATAHDDIRIGLHHAIQEPAEEVRKLELARLDKLLTTNIAIALSSNHENHTRMQATDRVLKIMDRRARYLGLDTPTTNPQTETIQLLAQLIAPPADDAETIT